MFKLNTNFLYWYIYFSLEDTYRANKRFTIIREKFGSGLMAFLLFLSNVGERCPLFWLFTKLSSKVFCSVLAVDYPDRMARTS